MVSRLAQAMPEAIMGMSSSSALEENHGINPSPPMNRQMTCVETRPIFRARTGSRNAMTAAVPFHTDHKHAHPVGAFIVQTGFRIRGSIMVTGHRDVR